MGGRDKRRKGRRCGAWALGGGEGTSVELVAANRGSMGVIAWGRSVELFYHSLGVGDKTWWFLFFFRSFLFSLVGGYDVSIGNGQGGCFVLPLLVAITMKKGKGK